MPSPADRVASALLAASVLGYHLASVSALTVDVGGRPITALAMDDSYITLRYARSLVDGHGFRWNADDVPVEGFTSPVWLLWAAALTLVVRDPAPLLVASAGVCHAVSVLLLHDILRRRIGCGPFTALAGAGALALWRPMVWQVAAAGEMNLVVMVLLASVDLLLAPSRRSRLLGAALAGCLLAVRPDAGLLLVLLAVGALLRERDGRLPLLGAFLAIPAVVIAWRALAFGALVPNTYVLKVPGRPGRVMTGARYVRRFLQSSPASPLLLLSLAAPWLGDPLLAAAAIGVPAVLVAVAWMGGDAWDQWRLLVAVLPLLLIVMGRLSARPPHRTARIASVACWTWLLVSEGVAAAAGVLATGRLLPEPRPATLENARVGLALARASTPDAVIAHFHAGAAPYYAERRAVDPLGRCDPAIARLPAPWPEGIPGHDKIDVGRLLALGPDIVVSHHPEPLAPAELERWRKPPNGFALALTEDPRFRAAYLPVESTLSRRWHGIFVRRGSTALDVEALRAAERELARQR